MTSETAALLITATLGGAGIAGFVTSLLGRKHDREERARERAWEREQRLLEKRADAYLALISTFDRDEPRDEVIDAKIVLYAAPEIRRLYHEWLESLKEGRPRRTDLENKIRDKARDEQQP